TYIVRGTHAHAWPEVYFEDYGWVGFEPTPRTIAPAPVHTREPQGDGPAPGEINPFSDPDLQAGGLGLDGRSNPRAGAGGGAQCPPEISQAECQANIVDPGANSGRNRAGAEDFAWQQRFAVIWRTSLVAAGLFLLLVPLLKELRTRRRYGRASSPSEVTAAAFSQFLDDASELAHPRAPSESAIAYAARLSQRRLVGPLQAGRLARLYEQAEYSVLGTTPEQASEAKRLARALRGSMWKEAAWWMRLRRLFAPTGLVTSLRRGPRPSLRSRRAG
ncbi:MAG: DUF4129 domain-containing protein, partial [Actinomycetota bacterium]